MKLQTGDIIARTVRLSLNPLSWISIFIRIFARIRYEHVSHIVVENGECMVFRTAVVKKYYKMPAETFLTSLKYDSDFVVYRPIYENFNPIKFAFESNVDLGSSYDFPGLIQQFFWNVFGLWISRSIEKAAKHKHCYERMWYLNRNCQTFNPWQKSKPEDLFINKYQDFKLLTRADFYDDKN